MLDYFQTLMEKMSFQFGAAGHYHRSFPPPSNTSAKTTASNCWRYYCLFALVYTTTCPPFRCAHTRRHHLACLVPGALVATSYSPALIGIGDRTQSQTPSTPKKSRFRSNGTVLFVNNTQWHHNMHHTYLRHPLSWRRDQHGPSAAAAQRQETKGQQPRRRRVEQFLSMRETGVGLKSSHFRARKWLLLSRPSIRVEKVYQDSRRQP
jgi:hypothetical protein